MDHILTRELLTRAAIHHGADNITLTEETDLALPDKPCPDYLRAAWRSALTWKLTSDRIWLECAGTLLGAAARAYALDEAELADQAVEPVMPKAINPGQAAAARAAWASARRTTFRPSWASPTSWGEMVVLAPMHFEFPLAAHTLLMVNEEDRALLSYEEHELLTQALASAADRFVIACDAAKRQRTHDLITIPGMGISLCTVLFPDHPHAEVWGRFMRQLLAEWTELQGHVHDAPGYDAVNIFSVIAHATAAPELSAFHEQIDWERILNRCVARYSPIGWGLEFGNDHGIGGNSLNWLAIFEWAAARYQNPSYRWASQALHNWNVRSKLAEGQSPESAELTALDGPEAVFAAIHMDESIAPQEPRLGSSVTGARHHIHITQSLDSFDPSNALRWGEDLVDKVILRGGWEPNDPFIACNLRTGGQHSHFDDGAILALVADGEILLHDKGYPQVQPEYHNLLYVQPAGQDEFPTHNPDYHIHVFEMPFHRFTIEALADLPTYMLTSYFARGYFHRAVDYRRSLLAARDGAFVAIYDDATSLCGSHEIGPLFHAHRARQLSDRAFLLDDPLPLTDEPTWPQLLAILPADCDTGSVEQHTWPWNFRNYTSVPTERLCDCIYAHTGLEEGQRVGLLSLLAPAASEEEGQAIAASTRELERTAGTVAVTFEARGATHIVGFATDGHRVDNKAIQGDTRMVATRQADDDYRLAFHDVRSLCIPGCISIEVSAWSAWGQNKNPAHGLDEHLLTRMTGELQWTGDKISGQLHSIYQYGLIVEVAITSPRPFARALVDGWPAELRDGGKTAIITPVGDRTSVELELA